jgi:PAS domain S-box-containing protein
MNEDTLFGSIYGQIEVPIFVVHIDANGDFVFGGLNPAREKATGLRNEDVVGKRLEEIPSVLEERAAALRAACQRCIEAGVEAGRQRRDGTLSDCSIYASPLHVAEGGIIGIIVVLVDTTERKRSEKASRRPV